MRFNITKLFDDAKAKATKAGQELTDFIQYLSEFCELCGRSLRNGLTFADNFDCEILNLTLLNNVETVVRTKKPVSGMLPLRITNVENYMVSGFGWRYTSAGEFAIKLSFDPVPTSSLQVTIVVFF